METGIDDYLVRKGGELLSHLGIKEEYIESWETVIIFFIISVIAFAAMEVAYRILLFITKRIILWKFYKFKKLKKKP